MMIELMIMIMKLFGLINGNSSNADHLTIIIDHRIVRGDDCDDGGYLA